MNKIGVNFKPCPLCKKEVRVTISESRDGTLNTYTVTHGPRVACGISLMDIVSSTISKEEALKTLAARWNTRPAAIRARKLLERINNYERATGATVPGWVIFELKTIRGES